MRSAALALAALLTALTSSIGVPGAGPTHRTPARTASIGPAAMRFGRSIGSPTEGRLVGGSHLDATPCLRIVPTYAAGDVRWGLEPLVSMIDRAARQVRRQIPGSVTSVGHLSRAGGGDLDRHRSHESGRDADIGFFIRNANGHELLASRFVHFRGDGTAMDWPGARFDDARNWALVAALLGDPEAHVTHLFVASPLRARLLAYAERMGASPALRMRAAELLQQPHGVLPHDDHFHVRIACPAHMSGCVENPAPRRRDRGSALALHGRRSTPVHALVTRPPTPAPKPAATPAPPVDRDDPPEGTDAPPADLATPVDDVDG